MRNPELDTNVMLKRAGVGVLLAAAAVFLIFAPQGRPFYATVGVLTLLSLVLAVSIRPLLVGGEASFAHGAFYAIGAYTVAILTTKADVPLVLAILAAGVVSAGAAVVVGVPSLRTSGASFFVMTFGFLVLITALIQSADGLTGGVSGIPGVPSLSSGDPVRFYYVALGLAAVTTGIFAVLSVSRWGLELRAVGDDPALATAAGVARTPLLLSAFIVGATFAGIAGGFFASFISFVSLSSFSFWLSVYVLTYVMVGGARSVWGPVVGTLVLGFVPVSLSWSDTQSGLFTAVLTLLILLVLPRGLVVTAMDRYRRRHHRGPTPAAVASASADVPVAMEPDEPVLVSEEVVLEVDGVTKAFGGVTALDDVTMRVRSGEILGLIGPNGAGKTTLFNVISGFVEGDSGSVAFAGDRISGLAPHKVVRRGLTRTFQASTVFPGLTVLENVLVAREKAGRPLWYRVIVPTRYDHAARERAHAVLARLGLAAWADELAGSLPYGIRKAVGVAVAMATEPKILCLDEPLAGLSDDEAADLIRVVRLLRREEGLTVIIIEHRLRHIANVCDRLVALDSGRLIADGAPSDVLNDRAIVEAYLGGAMEEPARG